MKRSLVALTVLLSGLVLSAPPTRAEPVESARATRPTTIRVATFNVLHQEKKHWRPRRATVLRLLRDSRADVVVLQEAEVFGRAAWQDPGAWLARKAGYAIVPTQTTISYDSPGGYFTASGSPMILFRPQSIRFERTPFAFGSGFYAPPARKGAYGMLVARSTGQRFTVNGLHLSFGKGREVDVRRRDELADVGAAQDWHVRHGVRSAPTIWAGDLNTIAARRDPVRRYLRGRGLVDAYSVATKRTHPRVNTFNGLRRRAAAGGRRIDQVWVPRGTRVLRWDQLARIRDGRYVGRFASDHNPVVVTIRLR